MGNATTDIVARLQLRAEQFSSETGARFAELKTRARSAAQEIREDFVGAFGEVQRLAATSLQLPRTSAGALDLSAEIKSLNAAASAADITAQAHREMSIAMTAAAQAAGGTNQAMLREADAAAVAALQQEHLADETRQRIAVLEAYQVELNKTVSETRRLTQSEEEAARRGGAGFANFGQQFIDFTVQVQSGQAVVTAFIQQMPQAAFALSTMGGAAGKVGAFLTGPWGVALTIGTMVLAPFVAKLWEGEEAFKAAELGADGLSQAQSVLGQMFDLTSGKLKKQNELLILNAQLTAVNLRGEAAQARTDSGKTFGNLGATSWENWFTGKVQTTTGQGEFARDSSLVGASAKALLARLQAKQITPAEAVKLAESVDMQGSKVSRADFIKAIVDQTSAKYKDATADEIEKALKDKILPTGLRREDKSKPKKAADRQGMSDGAEEAIARINAEWDDQPKLIDKAFLETQKLDNLIGRLTTKKPPDWQKLVQQAEAAKEVIQRGLITAIGKAFDQPETLFQKGQQALGELNGIVADLEKRKPGQNWPELVANAERMKTLVQEGMNRPFTDYVRQQRESLAVGQMILAGRDAEASALRDTLQLQQQLGRELSDKELATVRALAEQHERISRAMEDQRRVVGIYTGAFNELTDQADAFLAKLQGNATGVVGTIQKLQRSILMNNLFGGIDRKIEDYIRQTTGKMTPGEILIDQAKGAGAALYKQVDGVGDALREFTEMVRATTTALGGIRGSSIAGGPAAGNLSSVITGLSNLGADLARFTPANDNDEAKITVVGRTLGAAASELQLASVKASSVWEVATQGFIDNLGRMGVTLPKSITDVLKKDLPTVLEGISFGQMGGSVFSKITGGKDDKLASSVGGVLGDVAGKALGPAISKAVSGGLGKMLGSAAGPIGSILGGVLGNVVAGLFNSPKWSNSSLTMDSSGKVTGTAGTGKGSAEISAATNTASSVAEAVNSIITQLGARVESLAPITMGTWDGRYRVADLATTKALHSKNFGPDVLHDFGDDQQAAIQYAVAYQISHAVITGISEASKRILASGQNMETALNKVMMIEAIPKDLKAMLDPVGAAIDDLNRKWQLTVDALNEGGASAEQMAQAQQLYDLQLKQVKASTASASQTLKDFLDSIKIGSSSPYSLRDQEASIMAKLQPYLADPSLIGADQEKYQSIANAAIDIERQLYGSTQSFFDFLDVIQKATNGVITQINNVKPISPDVESPFAKDTASNTKTTAANTEAAADLLEEVRNLLQKLPASIADALLNDNSSAFLNEKRLFASN